MSTGISKTLQWSLIVLAAGPALPAARVASGAEVRMSIQFPGPASVIFSPDSRLLALECSDRIVVYDVQSRKRLWSVAETLGYVHGQLFGPVQFSPDGKLLAIAEGWKGATAADAELLRNPAAWQDPSLILRLTMGRAGVQLRNAKTGTLKGIVEVTSPAGDLLFAPDGGTVLIIHFVGGHATAFVGTASAEYNIPFQTLIDLYDLASGKCLAEASVDNDYRLYSPAIAPDGKTLATLVCRPTVSAAVSLRLWDLPNIRQRGSVYMAGRQAPNNTSVYLTASNIERDWSRLAARQASSRLVFSPDGNQLLTAGSGSVTFWDVQKGRAVRTIVPQGRGSDRTRRQGPAISCSLALRPDGAVAVLNTSRPDPGIWLCDRRTGTARPLGGNDAFTQGGILSSRGSLALTPCDQYPGYLSATPGAASSLLLRTSASSPGYLPTTQSAGFGNAPPAGGGGLVEEAYVLWDAHAGARLATLRPRQTGEPALPAVHSLAFSPDESMVASAPGNGIVTVWDVTADRPPPGSTQDNGNRQPAAKPRRRTWTSADGRFTMEAELFADSGDKITLRKKSGARVEIPLAKLSRQDRDYVEGRR